jgi:diguanylate cyclase (GGDEF)-like protein/PAS domain S-box-containing protein
MVGGQAPKGVHDRFRIRRGDTGWLELEIATTNLLDDPAMGGILLTAVPTEAADPRVGWFEAVVRQMSDVVEVLDGDGRILFAGPGIEQLAGQPADNLVGKLLCDVVSPAAAPGLERWLEYVLARPGEQATTDGPTTTADGREVHLEVQATNLLDDPLVQGLVLVVRDVTERRRVEAEARLAVRLLEASPLAILATDADGCITAWNPAVASLLGWSAEEAVGETFRSLGGHTADSLDRIYEDLPLLLRGGTVELETRVVSRDGTTIPAYIVASGLLDDDGTFAGFLVLGVDLREQDDAHQTLARTEGRWSALARRARELVAILDEGATTTYVGPGFASILGYDPESLLGTSLRDLLHPDDRGRPGGLEDVIAGRSQGYQRDYRVRHADGSWRVVEVEVTDQRAERYIGGFVMIGRDVTQRVAMEAANEHLAAAIDSTGAAVVVVGLDRRVVGWNRGAEQLLGWPTEEAIGSTPPVVPLDAGADDAIAEVESGGESRHFDAAAMRRDGTRVLLSVNASPVRDASGSVVASTWVAFDVTDQRAADREREVRAAQQSVIAAVTGRALGGAAVDDVLDEAARLASSTLRVAVRADLHDTPTDGPPDPGTVVCAIEGRDGPIGTLCAVAGDGRTLGEGDVAFLNALANVLGTVVDRSRVSDEMRRRALHDDLTDLPNRTLLVDRLDQAIQRSDRRHEPLAVLFVDLDRFKRVNDTLGHAAGDALLVETAARLVKAVRAGDTIARVGGDEFVVLCEDVADAAEASQLAERVVALVADPFVIDGVEVVVTASVGVVLADEDADAEALVRDADLAMYRAKQRGRARVETFDAAMRDEVRSRLGIEQALRQAVAEEKLHVVYQPQIDMLDGRLVGLEALVRWEDPDVAPLEPSALVGVADEIGLLDEISWFVLHDACAAVASLRPTHGAVAVSVNLGARQLGHPGLVARVTAALEEANVPAAVLVLEVTETDVVDEAAGRALAALRALGVRISLDDFGTGWSSLHRLTRLPVDEIKIDQSFVAGVGTDRGCDAVVRAVASLALELDLRLVAEGVERPDQRQRLVELGCRIGQGWLLGGPVPAEQLLPRSAST